MGKYLGQHFLVNKRKLRKIVEALDLKSGDVIIEIGAGHGELTKEIIQKFRNSEVKKFKIIAIEKDKKLIEILRSRVALPYREAPPCFYNEVMKDKDKKMKDKEIMVEIVEGDALKALPKLTNNLQLTTNDYKIAGNIPYYITGHLLRIISELENKPSLIVLTIQKEVAERIIAKSPKMNLLAASVQFWAKPEIIDFIPAEDFKPRPDVDSAIIKLSTLADAMTCHSVERQRMENYYKIVKILFKQPRKTILNNLTVTMTITKEDITKKLRKSGINPNDRPQNLDIEQIKELLTLF